MSEMIAREVAINNKSVTLLDNADFVGNAKAFSLVRKVQWEGGEWVWIRENFPDQTRGQFYQEGEKGYILIITASQITDIYDIGMLDKYILVGLNKNGVSYDGRGTTVQERIALKKAVAPLVGLNYKLLPVEELVARTISEEEIAHRREAWLAEQQKKQDEKNARKAAADKLRATIEARPRLKGYAGTNGGNFFNGSPIVGDEYLKLSGGSFCVEVASYDDETKTHGEIIGCFIIKKDGVRKSKTRESSFSFNRPEVTGVTKSIGEVVYKDDDGDICTAVVYASKEDLKALQSAGLNSGAVVAIRKDGGFQLIKVTKKMLTSIKVVTGVMA